MTHPFFFLPPSPWLFSWCGEEGWLLGGRKVSLSVSSAKLTLSPYPLVVVCLDYGGYCGHNCACSLHCSVLCTHHATWNPCTFLIFPPFFLFFSPPSADNKDRTQWWIWFPGDCKAAHASKALLQPAQTDSHHACSRVWCLSGRWLPRLPTPSCEHAVNNPQLQPHPARPVPFGIQQVPP